MLRIAGIGAAAAAVMLVGLAPVAFAGDNSKEYEPQTCGNQPFEGLAVGLLGLNSSQSAEKDEDCDENEHDDNEHDDNDRSDKHHD